MSKSEQSTGISTFWWSKSAYVMFKGHIMGIWEIPSVPKDSGHCPTLKLDTAYYDMKKDENVPLTYSQFKYLINRFRKLIKANGHKDFVLEVGLFFVEGREPITQNMHELYKDLHDFLMKTRCDCKRMDIQWHFDLKAWSSPR